MTFSKTILRVVLAFVGNLFAIMVAGMLVPLKNVPTSPHLLRWMLLSTALVVLALSAVALRTEWRGWKLGAAVAAIPLGIACINLLEGVVFLKTSSEWEGIFLYTLLSSALMIPVWTLLFGKQDRPAPEHYHPIDSQSLGERVWKFAVCDLAYLALYYGTGMIIFPYVKEFYATQHIPPLGILIALQLLIRGPVFVLVCLALTRMLGLPRLSGALAVGLVFTLLSGAAPLLIPNPYFPDSVRWVHFCEVTSENFVFGAIVAWLWNKPQLAHAAPLRQAA